MVSHCMYGENHIKTLWLVDSLVNLVDWIAVQVRVQGGQIAPSKFSILGT